MESRFSSRHGFSSYVDAPVIVRNDAPAELRGVLLQIANEVGFRPTQLRRIVCGVLRKVPDQRNWSEYPNVDNEVRGLVEDCEWYKIYDIIEALATSLRAGELIASRTRGSEEAADQFESELNRYFRETGIGWQVANGSVEMRGPEVFEQNVHGAVAALEDAHRETATQELREALRDLSRRPDPDVSGAIQHALAALECVARDATGQSKATLGEILKRNQNLLPKPIDIAVEKAWGYASEAGRHLKEGGSPGFDEAELLVGFAGAVCRYLAKKLPPL